MFGMTLDRISATVSGKIDEVGGHVMGGKRNTGLIIAAAACAILPLEISHLLSMIVGILAYMLLQSLRPDVARPQSARAGKAPPLKPQHPWNASPQARRAGSAAESRAAIGGPTPRSGTRPPAPRSGSGTSVGKASSHAEVRKPSAMPVQAPTFESEGWEAEVRELLSRIAPTAEGDALVERIARAIQRVIAPIIPEAEVSGFASGSVTGGTAFGVAVPEVDIVINVSPTVLLGRLQGRWLARSAAERLDAQKLRKSAIRACTDRLVGTGAFKFRRSAFRGTEPKVTIIAPSGDASGQGVPLNLSVNALTPLYNAALLAECGGLDPRARELILVVKRWAKDRGLCHAAKGHLSPYAWTLLVIYFCQVSDSNERPILPSLEGFSTCSGLMKDGCHSGAPKAPMPDPKTMEARKPGAKTTGRLFKDFVTFYTQDFDWRNEAVSVRLGRRAAPDRSLPIHIVLDGDTGASEVGPSVEDPFEPTQNLGACTTTTSLAHLRAELRRAEGLCATGASLSVLLEPWAPPEAARGQGSEEQEQEQDEN
mmetsp:Transcript_115061/g.305926  ORF Transcript_115061/g.305926 Transcript_115061/m.305926 type:complete len:540 (-) Transcript_115061:235-1854(-)